MKLLPEIFARRRLVLATALLLAVAGLLSWDTMPREEDPQFPPRDGLVITAFPGADAETVERLVIEPIEEVLAEVEEVEEVTSTARSGVAIVSVEILDEIYDTDRAWDDVAEALSRARHEFPAGVGEPVLDRDLMDQEAIVLALIGAADPLRLNEAAERLKRQLLALPEVKRVHLVADPGEQITIEYDDEVARRLGVDPRLLGLQLAARSRIVPGGVIHLGGKSANLRPQTDFGSLEEIVTTPILLPSGSSVPLGELARVRQGPAEPPRELMRWQGEPAIGLAVVPKDDLDRVELGHSVRELLRQVAPALAPLVVEEVFFQPDNVEKRLDDLTLSLRLGILIVAGLLFWFMGLRLGLLVAMVLPLVTFSSIAIFALTGGILHQISIAALVIALGMLVDNAIVMAESIQWRLDRGQPMRQAALAAVRELSIPLGTATGTTLAAFVPMLVSSGSTADFTRSIPVLIMLTLTMSYLFAVLVTPVLAELLLRRNPRARESRIRGLASWLAGISVRRPGWVLAGAALLLLVTLWAADRVDRQFFPAADRSYVIVDLEMPEGTHLEETDRVARQLETQLAARPEVETVAAFVGRAAPRFFYNLMSRPNSPHRAQLVAEAESVEAVERLLTWSRDFARRELPEVEVVARRLEQGPPLEAPVVVRILGHDLEDLELAADAVLAELRAIEGTRDSRHDLGLGVPTVVFRVDDAAAGRHGLARADVAAALLGRTLGSEIGQYRVGDDPVPILVRSSAGEQLPAADLPTLDVAAPGTRPVPLAQLAELEVEWRPAAIHHRDRHRVVRVLSQLAEGSTASQVLAQLAPRLGELELPAGVRYELGGEVEESGDANQAIFGAMPLGLLLLLFFLLAEFNSFRRVGIVLMTVPLAATGVVPGLLLSGNPFGFMSMLGVVALVGIVVNNAIVLLDVVESLRGEGLSLEEALTEAVRRRTRPILLTMATTVAGLSPLAFSNTSLWPPLAWAMISGLMASTVLTLLVIPALYKVLFSRPSWTLPDRFRRRAAVSAAALLLLAALVLAAPSKAQQQPLELTLEEVAARAAERPQAMAAAHRAAAAVHLATAERRAATLPSVGVFADLTRRDRDFDFETPLGSFTLGDRTSDSSAVEVRQPLLEPARLFYAVPAARSEAAAAALRAERTRQEIAASATRSFLRVLAVDATRRSTETFIESLEARLAETQERVAAGRTLEADALKVRLDLESARLDRVRLEESRRVAALELGRAVGHDGPVEPLLTGVALDRPETPPAAQLTAAALARRPDIEALTSQLHARQLRARAVRAERYPRLGARATWTRSSGDPFRPEELLEGAVALTWSPFAAGTRKPRAAALESEAEVLAADLSELRRAIAVEVHDALANITTAREAVAVRRRGVELASETLRVERERHSAGRSTTNDLLDAEANLRRQSTLAELARFDLVGAWIRLDLATGAGFGGQPPAASAGG